MHSSTVASSFDGIYLDYHSTTPVDPKVAAVVSDCMTQLYANPSSPHSAGQSARDALNEARRTIAGLIGALSGEVVFTSGATESNNLAIQGLTKTLKGEGNLTRNRILTSAIEHKSVTKTAEAVESDGFEHRSIPVDATGRIDMSALDEMIDERTMLVSVQAANNEIGTVQPIAEVSEIAHSKGAYVHCDAAQALGRVAIDVNEWDVDLLSLSAHKAYGPKGIGVLYCAGGASSVPVSALQYGGGQESGLSPGTQNVPGIVGFGEACRIIGDVFDRDVTKMSKLRDQFEERVLDDISESVVVGSREDRLPSTTNIHFPGLEAEAILARMPSVALSTGSACESGAPEPSHVLQAIGLSREAAYECIRVAVGRYTTAGEIAQAAEMLTETVADIRQTMAGTFSATE